MTSARLSVPYGVAVCAPGLEALVRGELEALGMQARETPGAVEFGPGAHSLSTAIALANVGSRVATRVLLVVGEGKARTFDQLKASAGRVDWTEYLPSAVRVGFSVTARKSRLYHTGAIIERLESVVPGASANAGNTVTVPARATVYVRLQKDRVTFSLDTTGELLHRRGYRTHTSRAPMRETLAAAALMSAGWDPTTPLLDPMCGSGTFVIEAALMALQRAPGHARRFALHDWTPGWRGAIERVVGATEAARPRERVTPDLVGVDRDARAIAAARHNATEAGVTVDFVHADAGDAAATPGPPGLIICNPPYGRRLGGPDGALRTLRDLHSRFEGWRLAVVRPGPVPPGFDSVWMASNGGIRVRLLIRD